MVTYMLNFMKYKKSPFIIATSGGILALTADVFWLVVELLTHFTIISVEAYVIYRICILLFLTLSIFICIIGVIQYVKVGYIRAEEHNLYCTKKEDFINKRNLKG
jgi:hypothetical protein